jgi:hypothetical protein
MTLTFWRDKPKESIQISSAIIQPSEGVKFSLPGSTQPVELSRTSLLNDFALSLNKRNAYSKLLNKRLGDAPRALMKIRGAPITIAKAGERRVEYGRIDLLPSDELSSSGAMTRLTPGITTP